MTTTTLRRVKPDAYGIVAGQYYSLEQNSGTVYSRVYDSTGAYLSERGSEAVATGFVSPACGIQRDSAGFVAPGSWAWRIPGNNLGASSGGRIYVWDVVAETLYSRDSESTGMPHMGAGALRWDTSAVGYYNGRLYWWEFKYEAPAAFGTYDIDLTANLYRSRCDLTDVTLIGTVTDTFTVDHSILVNGGSMALNTNAALMFFRYGDLFVTARLTLAGGGGAMAEIDLGAGDGGFLYLPGDDGTAVGLGGVFGASPTTWVSVPDALVGSVTELWPTSGDYAFDDRYAGWTSPDGTDGLIFGYEDSDARLVRTNATGAPGAPTVVEPIDMVDGAFAHLMPA